MQKQWQSLFEQLFSQHEQAIITELKQKLLSNSSKKPEYITHEYANEIREHYQSLIWKSRTERSWFKHELLELLDKLSGQYHEKLWVNGFIQNEIPKLQQSFKRRYKEVNEATREKLYFDADFALSEDLTPIIQLIARAQAYRSFTDDPSVIQDLVEDEIEKEENLVDTNHFNRLRPVDVLNYFLQLTQVNPKNERPFLTKEQVCHLTNMICRNQPVAERVSVNLLSTQRQIIVYTFYIFFKYCQDGWDTEYSREKYLDLLYNYTEQINFQLSDVTNFARKPKVYPIVIDHKYLIWKN